MDNSDSTNRLAELPESSDHEAEFVLDQSPDHTVRPARPVCLLDGPPPPKPPDSTK
ncbi:MAG: hypothetical protein K2W96_08545 [Gemmataceae bacterium]|nr:hypothetical protein [Gemmataceae bacterium]